jgi:hypothetical protein
MTEKPIGTEAAAAVLGVHRKTLLKMANDGRLDGAWYVPTGIPNGRRLFIESKLLEYRQVWLQSASTHTAASV